jgi:hypothetical protein
VAEAGDLEKGPGWWRGMGFAVAGCEDEGEGDAREEVGGRTPGADVDRFVRQADAEGVGERWGGGGWSAFRGGQAGRGWGRSDGGGGGCGGGGACSWWFRGGGGGGGGSVGGSGREGRGRGRGRVGGARGRGGGGPGPAAAAAAAMDGTVEGAVDAAAEAEAMADGERVSSSRARGDGAASCAGADPLGEEESGRICGLGYTV